MKIIRPLILFLTLISCSQKQTQEEQKVLPKNEVRPTLDTVSSSLAQPIEIIDKDDYSHGYKTKELRKLYGDSLDRIMELSRLLYKMIKVDSDSVVKIYHLISPYRNLKQQEILLSNSIRYNNYNLLQAVYSDLTVEGEYEFSDDFHRKLNERWYPLENSDSTILKFVFENLEWSARNRQDSAYRLIRSIDSNRPDLLKFYLDNGWSEIVNTVVGLDESGDASFDGYAPVDWALLKADTALASLLIKNGAQLDEESLTIYADSFAVEYVFNGLIKNGYEKNEILDSCLWHPTMYGQAGKVKTLMTLGADSEEQEQYENNTPIFNTIKQYGFPFQDPTLNKLKTLKILIDNGANIDHQNKNGITPLMYSSARWWSDGLNVKLGFAKLLLRYGANSELIDANGHTFWDHIILNNNKIFMEYFKDQKLTPEKYQFQYDSMVKTIERDMNWVYPIVELEE